MTPTELASAARSDPTANASSVTTSMRSLPNMSPTRPRDRRIEITSHRARGSSPMPTTSTPLSAVYCHSTRPVHHPPAHKHRRWGVCRSTTTDDEIALTDPRAGAHRADRAALRGLRRRLEAAQRLTCITRLCGRQSSSVRPGVLSRGHHLPAAVLRPGHELFRIRDAINLAWKPRARAQGVGGRQPARHLRQRAPGASPSPALSASRPCTGDVHPPRTTQPIHVRERPSAACVAWGIGTTSSR